MLEQFAVARPDSLRMASNGFHVRLPIQFIPQHAFQAANCTQRNFYPYGCFFVCIFPRDISGRLFGIAQMAGAPIVNRAVVRHPANKQTAGQRTGRALRHD